MAVFFFFLGTLTYICPAGTRAPDIFDHQPTKGTRRSTILDTRLDSTPPRRHTTARRRSLTLVHILYIKIPYIRSSIPPYSPCHRSCCTLFHGPLCLPHNHSRSRSHSSTHYPKAIRVAIRTGHSTRPRRYRRIARIRISIPQPLPLLHLPPPWRWLLPVHRLCRSGGTIKPASDLHPPRRRRRHCRPHPHRLRYSPRPRPRLRHIRGRPLRRGSIWSMLMKVRWAALCALIFMLRGLTGLTPGRFGCDLLLMIEQRMRLSRRAVLCPRSWANRGVKSM